MIECYFESNSNRTRTREGAFSLGRRTFGKTAISRLKIRAFLASARSESCRGRFHRCIFAFQDISGSRGGGLANFFSISFVAPHIAKQPRRDATCSASFLVRALSHESAEGLPFGRLLFISRIRQCEGSPPPAPHLRKDEVWIPRHVKLLSELSRAHRSGEVVRCPRATRVRCSYVIRAWTIFLH